jgi:hypothetical protein
VRVGYAGGLGLFNDAGGGFTIQNAYELGLAYTFQVRKAFCDVSGVFARHELREA